MDVSRSHSWSSVHHRGRRVSLKISRERSWQGVKSAVLIKSDIGHFLITFCLYFREVFVQSLRCENEFDEFESRVNNSLPEHSFIWIVSNGLWNGLLRCPNKISLSCFAYSFRSCVMVWMIRWQKSTEVILHFSIRYCSKWWWCCGVPGLIRIQNIFIEIFLLGKVRQTIWSMVQFTKVSAIYINRWAYGILLWEIFTIGAYPMSSFD